MNEITLKIKHLIDRIEYKNKVKRNKIDSPQSFCLLNKIQRQASKQCIVDIYTKEKRIKMN